MPIYEYVCDSCGHQFDKIQKMSDSNIQKCENCGKEAKRIISQTSFMLKGTGWYATDYAGKKAHTSSSDSAPACGAGGCASGACPKAS
jgi:putative FmdB family regulatory protein